jgi:hypothetical protein
MEDVTSQHPKTIRSCGTGLEFPMPLSASQSATGFLPDRGEIMEPKGVERISQMGDGQV